MSSVAIDVVNLFKRRQGFDSGRADHAGFRLQSLTTTQRDALTGEGAAAAGDHIYNSTNTAMEWHNGSYWWNAVGKRPIIADGTGVTLTTADSGGLVVMDKTDGSLTTLPAIDANNIGMWFEFQWPASYASGTQKIITGNAADFIVGTITKLDTDTLTDPLSVESYNGTTHIAVVIDAVTDGGLLGSWLRFTAISATQWLIQGMLHHSGNVSATVSTS